MIYCFICTNCEHRAEVQRPMKNSKKPLKCSECGKKMRRDISAEHGRFKVTPGAWPMESDAAGVNPVQIPEAIAYAEKMGVPTDYNPETGAPILTSRKHRKEFCKISGLYDRNAGYGDQSPKHNMRKRGKQHA